MAEALSRRPVVEETWVRSQFSLCDFVVDRVKLGEVCLRDLWFSPFTIMPCHFIFILELLLSEGETGQAWEPSKTVPFLQSKALDRTFLITFSFTLQTTLPHLFNLPGKHHVLPPVTDVSDFFALNHVASS